jgi:hypothetical protein
MYFETGDKIMEVEAKLNERINIIQINFNKQLQEKENIFNKEIQTLKDDLTFYQQLTFRLKMELDETREYIRLPWYKKIFKKL